MDKRQPYETDIRVPLLIAGPGIVSSTINAPVSSVDIFATVLNMAGVDYPSDGTTLLKMNQQRLMQDRTVLIEYRGESSKNVSSGCPSDYDPNVAVSDADYLYFLLLSRYTRINFTSRSCAYRRWRASARTLWITPTAASAAFLPTSTTSSACSRTTRYRLTRLRVPLLRFETRAKRVSFQKFIEAYDLTVDEYQMTNIGYTMKRGMRHRFRKRLARLIECRDADCLLGPPASQKSEETSIEYEVVQQATLQHADTASSGYRPTLTALFVFACLVARTL